MSQRTDESQAVLTLPVSARDHVQGPAKASVTLVEYGDYQCPHCGAAYPILQEIQKAWGDRLRFVYRNFPLTTVHPDAENAAEAAEAAGSQGKFWEMHDYLFEHQSRLDTDALLSYAQDLGLDIARSKHELHSHTFAGRVREDFLSGIRSGVNGAPTFFINDLRHDGPWDFESLGEAIVAASRESQR